MKTEPILSGFHYHIYNRGNNGTDIFYEKENYQYFMNLYDKYVEPVTETYAWCLMKNHFHLLVYIKAPEEIAVSKLQYSTVEKPRQINASRQFSHLFNAYSQSINKRYSRTGSLFEKPFERKLVDSMYYFRELIFYIHNNPVHHGFTARLQDYTWSSYASVISHKTTKLQREKLIDYFDSVDNFIEYHNQKHDLTSLTGLLFD
jgi:REP element-mobilizing transposase RayT